MLNSVEWVLGSSTALKLNQQHSFLWLSNIPLCICTTASSFVQFFYVFLPPLLNIFCFCQSHNILSFIEPIFAWNIPLISLIFLKRSLVFPILLFSSISLHGSLRKAFLSLLAILWKSAFKWEYLSFSTLLLTSLLFTAICKASSDGRFAFLHLFISGMVLISVSYTMSWISIHSSSVTLSMRSSPLKLFLTSTV